MILAALLACAGAPPPVDTRVVVLVVWDTVRADAVGPEVTPRAHELARDGTRFVSAYAHAPTTLSSHTSILSGLDPHAHAVPRNGYVLAGGLPWLPSAFQDAGWDTIAVVGSTVLDPSLGMGRGFRVYDAVPVDEGRFEDPADRVVERALARVEGRLATKPLFLFVHLYDAHNPYTSAPVHVRERFLGERARTPVGSNAFLEGLRAQLREGRDATEERALARGAYLAEVAWLDEQTGVLLDGLRARGLGPERLVVLTSDHGEMLDEQSLGAPYGHGADVDLPAIHVPLIVSGEGRFAQQAGVREDVVSLTDVATTIARAAGLAVDLGAGRDLFGSPAPRVHLAEATQPALREAKDRWNNLPFERGALDARAIWLEGGAAVTGLRAREAGEPALEDAARAGSLQQAVRAWDARAPGFVAGRLDPVQVEALRALGYVE